jgi:hypothetical protein
MQAPTTYAAAKLRPVMELTIPGKAARSGPYRAGLPAAFAELLTQDHLSPSGHHSPSVWMRQIKDFAAYLNGLNWDPPDGFGNRLHWDLPD